MKKRSRHRLPTANLEAVSGRIRKALSDKDLAREKALRLCREVIRHSAGSIRAVHRREFVEARDLLANARGLVDEVASTLSRHRDLYHGGLVHDAQKEFAEASATLAMAEGHRLPTPAELGVELAAYLNGLGEAAGELRRYLLDKLRRGEQEGCEDILSMMDDIYGVLVTMDFPDAITGGLRRTTDMVRGVLERTRGDLTLAAQYGALEAELRKSSG